MSSPRSANKRKLPSASCKEDASLPVVTELETQDASLPVVTELETQGAGASQYFTISEAVKMRGVRYTCFPECPAPISEPLKQLLWIKRIPAARVVHATAGDVAPRLTDVENNTVLKEATGQTSWPVLWYDKERPRTAWLEQLELVERLGRPGTPQLLPTDLADRATCIGYIHLIMGERGFFWMRRLWLKACEGTERGAAMARKYSYQGDLEAAPSVVEEMLKFFDEVLQQQLQKGSRYLVGSALSAVDVYWALASILCIQPAEELVAADERNAFRADLPTARMFLAQFQDTTVLSLASAITPRLREHQDHVIRTYCNYPLK